MHSRLERYLEELERPLTALTPEARAEWREEARQHLAALAAAHEELGSSPEEAVEAALRQFGDARQIGRQVQQSSPEGLQKGGSWRAIGRAYLLFSAPLMAGIIAMIGFGYAYVLSLNPAALDAMRVAGACAFVAVPVAGGWRVGRRMPGRRPGMHLLAALALSFFAVPIAGVFLHPALGFGQGADFDARWGLLWLPTASLSATLASWWTRQRRRA
jgi:hypothetical protein